MTSSIPLGIFRFKKLDLAPPPASCFEELIGVEGDARFIAIWYFGNKIFLGDGRQTVVGDSRPWVLWRWNLTPEILGNFCFGFRNSKPDHYLILDRLSRRLYAAPASTALETLSQQFLGWPEQAVVEEVPEEWTMDLFEHISDEECLARHEKMTAGMRELNDWIRKTSVRE